MTNEFAKIERDSAGNVKGLVALDPREVTIVRDDAGEISAYLWLPSTPEVREPPSDQSWLEVEGT